MMLSWGGAAASWGISASLPNSDKYAAPRKLDVRGVPDICLCPSSKIWTY